MKKLLSLIVIAALALSLAACGAKTPEPEEDAAIRVASLKGPTTMGLVKLLEDAKGGALSYGVESEIYGAADEITGLLVNGDVDAAAIPANLASVLYNKTGGAIKVAAVNTLGVLYIVENGDSINSVADLRGKTVYSTGKGTTPEYVLNSVLKWNGLEAGADVTVEFKSEATEIAALLSESTDGAIALLPMPYVTTVLMQNEGVRIALDLTKEWKAASGKELVTGVLAVRSDYIDSHPLTFAAFLADYETSAAYVNGNPSEAAALIESYGIVAKAAVAEKALPYCNITFVSGGDMKSLLSPYLEALYEQNPQAVGGALPGDDFYYGA